MTIKLDLPSTISEALQNCSTLPSPPAVAANIIQISSDPSSDLGTVADAVSKDPALSAKILRIANSPLYSRNRTIDNLRQAISFFGLDGTLNIALSFSLKASGDKQQGAGLDYNLFWRRSLVSAILTQQLGVLSRCRKEGVFFLAGLIQDIGMLAMNETYPNLYQNYGGHHYDHEAVCAHENSELGCDHSLIGGWLLNKWNLPDSIINPVLHSHQHSLLEAHDDEEKLLNQCVGTSSILADMFINDEIDQLANTKISLAMQNTGMSKEKICHAVETTSQTYSEMAEIFEIDAGDKKIASCVLEQAKEALMMRNLQSMQESKMLMQTAAELERKTNQLEHKSRIDNLTNVYNRNYLDVIVKDEFTNARNHYWPLGIVFIDIDHFKQVNDTYGHQAGDQILSAAAQMISENLRNSDYVGRYGGEEFVAVLPGAGVEAVNAGCARILNTFRNRKHILPCESQIKVTVSLGAVIMNQNTQFDSHIDLIHAADQMCYESKNNGRNQYTIYNVLFETSLQPSSLINA